MTSDGEHSQQPDRRAQLAPFDSGLSCPYDGFFLSIKSANDFITVFYEVELESTSIILILYNIKIPILWTGYKL